MIKPGPLARVGAALAVTVSLMALAACASASPAPSAVPTEAMPASPTPTPEASESATAEAVPPTCEGIIPATTVADFASVGWTVQADIMRVGTIELPSGVECTWADFSVPTDHVQVYGWAEISPEDAATAQQDLIASGWRREDGPDGVYITEGEDTIISPDDEGYGMTYLFGDGWVALADTKQGLLLVSWPPA